MLKRLLTKAPFFAIIGAILLFVLVAAAGLGLDWPLLLALAVSIFAVAEGVALRAQIQKTAQGERHLRHIRFIADRFQSMLRSMPGGYCLFTPQGLLREEHGVSKRLGVEKITHLDDLIGGVKDGPDLLVAFRRLQSTGESFTMDIRAAKDARSYQVNGRRFRIGPDGPHVDVLWVCDHPHDVAAMATAVAATMSRKDSTAEESAAAATPSTASAPAAMNFDALPLPIWGRTKDLRLVMCNAAYARAVAAAPEAALAEQHELMPTDSKAGKALAQAALTKGEPLTERDHAVVDGSRRLLQITERPIQDASDAADALAVLGFAVDVTAEEEKAMELRRHTVSHHEVMEHLSAAISVFGPDTRLEFYNRAYQQLWGAEEAFLDTKPTFSDVMEDQRARRRMPEQIDFQKHKKEYLALFTSLLQPREDTMFLPDGTSLRILVAPHPLGGLMFVHENVTDQLALETSYNTLMAVQRETIDNLAEGIAVFGADGRVRLHNIAFTKLWNLSEDFLETEPHASDVFEAAKNLLNSTESWGHHKEDLVGYALDRTPRSGRMERTDKTVVEYQTIPLPDGSVLNSYLDITDSVHVEQALRASNAALAEADRLKSDFVANVSYQLRTPLNTITGFAEILAEQYFGTLNDRQLEYTTTIKVESEKLSRLINDVLDLATIEAGRMTLDRAKVNVAGLLNTAKQMTAEWARQQSLEIIIDCPSDLGTIEVDEHRIKQVLFNLIGNAIKYTPAGGHIAIAAWKQEPWIVISVLDTGVGIPQADQKRVFGKFEKANRKLRQGGAGLGLSLVKSFVELHGGRVEIFSDEKDGTRVSCFLPIKTPEE